MLDWIDALELDARVGVKPPFYVPLPDRVSGTGGRMFRA